MKLLSSLAIVALGALAALPFAGSKADFALLDMSPGVADVSVQCGAINGSTAKPKPAPFTAYITMTNRPDLGGADGFVRVTYHDGEFVDYAIAAGATLQITLAGGGTVGVDDLIGITGGGGAILTGQLSIRVEKGKPHPDLPGQDGSSFATTTPAAGS